MRRLSWIVTIPITLLVVSFALSNRETAELGLWPFDVTVSTPLFVAVLLPFLLGMALGGFVSWALSVPARRQARVRAGRVRALEAEAARLRAKLEAEKPAAESSASPPAIR